MHFVIDALGISKPGGGRSSVLRQLCSVFELDQENDYTVVVDSWETAFAKFANVEQRVARLPNRFAAHLAEQFIIPAVARSAKASLVHHTKNLCSFFNPCPYVVTIHDMTTLKLAWTQSWADVSYWRTMERISARKSALILTPSNDAKRDVTRCYGVAGDKIKVIHWAPAIPPGAAADERDDIEVRRRYGIDGTYILFVGILALKKNLPTLIRAFSLLKQDGRYHGKLVIVGREYPQSREKSVRDLAAEIGLGDQVVFTGPLPDEHLPAFYRGADAFTFPSLHEGFGIVLLEAMACGTPVVSSGTSSMPEVVGDAGVLVQHPRDEALWADALREVLFNADLRRSLIMRGIERSQEFSWEKVGRETLASYIEAVCGASAVEMIEGGIF